MIGQLFVEDRLLSEGGTHPAPFLRPGRGGPTLRRQLAPDASGEFVLLLRLALARGPKAVPAVAELLPNPVSQLLPPGFILGREPEVHRTPQVRSLPTMPECWIGRIGSYVCTDRGPCILAHPS